MIKYATLDDLRRFRGDLRTEEREALVKRAADRSPAGSTFLSHSSQDAEFLPGVIKLLENHGATVYIDKKDNTLPPFTSRDTATTLRSRISQCDKFILFATPRSKDSRWIPWELGIADGIKKPASTAVLPSPETASDVAWAEREYLGIYDRVVWGDLKGYTEKVWMVWNQEKNTATLLTAWLAS